MLRSDLYGYGDTYIVVQGRITVERDNDDKTNKKLIFKNNAPIRLCIPKTNNTFVDNACSADI